MTDDRIASDLHGRVHHNVLNHGVSIVQTARILCILSSSPESVSTIVVEISSKEIAINERHLNTVHIPSIDSLTEALLTGIFIRDGQRGLVGGADRGRIQRHRDGGRSIVNLNTLELRDVGRTSHILIDDLHSVLMISNICSRNRDSVHIVDRITVCGLLIVLIPLILILGVVADLIDNSLEDSIAALANLLRSRNNNIRNRSNHERVNRREARVDTTFTINLNGELVGELSAIVCIDGINREGQVSGFRTGDAMSIRDVLVVDQPSVGVTLKIVVDNSGEGDNIMLTSSLGTGDVSLEVFHRRNSEGFRNANTTVLAGHRQGVHTIAVDRNVSSGLAVAPSVGVVTGRSNRGGDGSGGGTGSVIMVAAERHDRSSVDGNLIIIRRSGELRSTTSSIRSAHSVHILASFIERQSNRAGILTFNHDTILIPSIGIVLTATGMVSSQRNLLASTDVVSAELQGRLARNAVNSNLNRTVHCATTSCGGNLISFGTGRGGDCRNGGTCRSIEAAASPSISNILIAETIEVGVQDNRLALADFHSVSRDLEISTSGVDREVSRGNTIGNAFGNRGCINTSEICGQIKASTSLRASPSDIVSRIDIGRGFVGRNEVRGKRGRTTIANHVVASNRNLRNSIDMRMLARGLHDRGTAHIISSFC